MKKYFLCIVISYVLLSCSSQGSQYPAHWWKPVPPEEAYSWEILPQAAGEGEVILSKRNELGLLSNFAATAFILDNKHYASIEGFWQMLKFPENENDPRYTHLDTHWTLTREQVAQMVGHEAKNAGKEASLNMKKMNINWVSYQGKQMTFITDEKGEHYQLIVRAMLAKLEQNPNVSNVLIQTKGLKLLPDHIQRPNSPPAWPYHKIWMEIRDQL